MNLTITAQALSWFQQEMDATEGDAFRFFVRLGGCSTAQSGFSLGVTKEAAKEAGLAVDEKGYHFFIEQEDLWYLDGHDLTVDTENGALTYLFS
ncbi:Iron-sulfur cluster biosynthesis [Fictibacillus macauensis ZFHKF-1]|uniref:Iron-sulfur cluster biosynthesis n=1 Tax=Fictibacillus macauensis ZFHKF-1 TaxID=1196324 RepID=I8UIZ5_9BACL|nr:HesB/YadR/YfhF family protein [Fictibacillus macauensis]EIT86860.1 Iron-sulfur cluster biosynthesis [Fictibacillus macauensis ZFHKF-1]